MVAYYATMTVTAGSSYRTTYISSVIVEVPFPLPDFLLPGYLFGTLHGIDKLSSTRGYTYPELTITVPRVPVRKLVLT